MKTPEAQDQFNPLVIVCPTGKSAGKQKHYQAHLVGAHSGRLIGTFSLPKAAPTHQFATQEVEKLIEARKWKIKNFNCMVISEDASSYIV